MFQFEALTVLSRDRGGSGESSSCMHQDVQFLQQRTKSFPQSLSSQLRHSSLQVFTIPVEVYRHLGERAPVVDE